MLSKDVKRIKKKNNKSIGRFLNINDKKGCKFQYETSKSNYMININTESNKRVDNRHPNFKSKPKSHAKKKLRFVTEQIQKSTQDINHEFEDQCLKSDKTFKKYLEVQDQNIYQLYSTSRKKPSESNLEKTKYKITHWSPANIFKMKSRTKQHSQSQNKLTVKSLESIKQSKDFSKISIYNEFNKSPRNNKAKKETHQFIKSPNLLLVPKLQFESYNMNQNSKIQKQNRSKQKYKKTDNLLTIPKRTSNYLFQSSNRIRTEYFNQNQDVSQKLDYFID